MQTPCQVSRVGLMVHLVQEPCQLQWLTRVATHVNCVNYHLTSSVSWCKFKGGARVAAV